MTDTETNGRIIKVGNPNRLVKYAQKHPEEDFFFHGDTGVLREGGRIVLGETWYYITGDVFPVYENGIYMGAKWFNDELSERPELSGLLRGIVDKMEELKWDLICIL